MRWLLVLFALVMECCRVAPPTAYWIETHGRAQLRQIAASPRGTDGIGGSGEVYRYPGDYAVPWRSLAKIHARHVGASSLATYVLDDKGLIWKVTPDNRTTPWNDSIAWQASFVTGDDHGGVYVISSGQGYRVQGSTLVPLPCLDPATQLAPSNRGVYVLLSDGTLRLAEGEACSTVEAPGRVTSVTAYGGRAALVVGGAGYEMQSGTWQPLPPPFRYRESGRHPVELQQVAVSANSLWSRDVDGYVYVLWEAS